MIQTSYPNTSVNRTSNSSTCKHKKVVGHANSLVLHNTFFFGVVQLSEPLIPMCGITELQCALHCICQVWQLQPYITISDCEGCVVIVCKECGAGSI